MRCRLSHRTDDKVEKHIEIFEDQRIIRRKKKVIPQEETKTTAITPELELAKVSVSLLDKDGKLPTISGLNWGQRKGREPSQAYIRLISKIYNTNFFPPVGTRFTLLTDDNEIFICSRAQANGKAIHTPENNSIIGKYFRRRLGIPLGAPVRLADVLKYGRTDVEFYKLDDESFYMDFSPKKNG